MSEYHLLWPNSGNPCFHKILANSSGTGTPSRCLATWLPGD